MQREPAARYATAKEMAEELRRFQAGQLLVSREYRIRDLLARWVGRHKAAVAVGGVAAVALAVVAVLAVVNITRSRDAERDARVLSRARAGPTPRDRSRRLLEEQGRSELVGGHRDRALAYLAEAYQRGRDTPALRHMLAAVDARSRPVGRHDARAGDQATFRELAFLPDSGSRCGRPLTTEHARRGSSSSPTARSRSTFSLDDDDQAGKFSPDGKRLVTTTLEKRRVGLGRRDRQASSGKSPAS